MKNRVSKQRVLAKIHGTRRSVRLGEEEAGGSVKILGWRMGRRWCGYGDGLWAYDGLTRTNMALVWGARGLCFARERLGRGLERVAIVME